MSITPLAPKQRNLAAPVTAVPDLYARVARRLERAVGRSVGAPQPLIEDACQTAWSRLLVRECPMPEAAAFAWLLTTAVREAIKLSQRQARFRSLEERLEAGESGEWDAEPGVDQVVERRERLASISRLPVGQQRALWLLGLGLSYGEIAGREGCSERSVERRLYRGRQRLRAAA